MEKLGFSPDVIVKLDLDSGRYHLPDNYFDIVFSDNVIEHVENLSLFCKEVSRLTVCGGLGAHIFPSHHKIKEPHVKIPFIHWLPKSSIRYRTLKFAIATGIDARWVKVHKLPNDQAAKVYYDYLDQNTHYRQIDDIKVEFEKAALFCDTSLTGKIIVEKLFPRSLHTLPGLSKSLERLSLYFHTSVLITQKNC